MSTIIKLIDLEIAHLSKCCFENFTGQVTEASRIAIIGRNGSGKSSLLKVLAGQLNPTSGQVIIPEKQAIQYIPQVIAHENCISGGTNLFSRLSKAFDAYPMLLLLDEPTNHLDHVNRLNLVRRLKNYRGTLIMATHDRMLLRHCVDTLWHIEDQGIQIFKGQYDDYTRSMTARRTAIESALLRIKHRQKNLHDKLMQEQHRAAQSRAKGQKNVKQHKWPTVISTAKAHCAQENAGRKKSELKIKKQQLTNELQDLKLPRIILPKFVIQSHINSNHAIIEIHNGSIFYSDEKPILTDVTLTVKNQDCVAIMGANGSGKSSLVKAILNCPTIIKQGQWFTPASDHIGYLDQHYQSLNPAATVEETIRVLVPHWSYQQIREHLNDFLFSTNEQVRALTARLSGGEQARLCLAQIAVIMPKILILDEITNNLDYETTGHVIDVLKSYPGALMIISHDEDFLQSINIKDYYIIEN